MKLPNDSLDKCCGKSPTVEWDGGAIRAQCRKCKDFVESNEMWRVMITWNLRKRKAAGK